MDVALNMMLPEEKKKELEEAAVKKGLSLSGLVRMVLYEYMMTNFHRFDECGGVDTITIKAGKETP